MRKLVFLLAALIAVSPASAATKKARPAKDATVAQPMTQNQASWRLVKESLPLFLPSVAMWLYFHHQNEVARAEAAKADHKGQH